MPTRLRIELFGMEKTLVAGSVDGRLVERVELTLERDTPLRRGVKLALTVMEPA